MAIFEIQGPDGSIYEVDAPDEGAAVKAFQGFSAQQPAQAGHSNVPAFDPGIPGYNPETGMVERQAQPSDPALADRAAYDALPGWQKPFRAADDIVRLIANGVTFGYADKLAAASDASLAGKDYDKTLAENRKLSEAALNRAGTAGPVAEGIGSLAVPMGAASKGISLSGRFGTDMMKGAKGLMARSGLMAAEGIGYGALTAAGHDQDLATGAGIGMLGGLGGNVVGEGLAAGVSKVAGKFNPKEATKTVDDFMREKDAAYKAAEVAGVVFSPQAMTRLRDEVAQEYASKAYHPRLQPKAAVPLDELDRLASQNVTLSGLDAARQIAGDAFEAGNAKNNMLTRTVADKIDDLIRSPKEGDILMGNAPEAAQAIAQARAAYHQGMKLKKLNELFERGEFNAATSGSGGNLQNATRAQLKRVLTNKGWDRGFTQAEKKAVEGFVRGTAGQNMARAIGAMSPAGNGLGKMLWGAALGGGAMAGGIPALLLAGAGAGGTAASKKIAESLTRGSFEKLQRTIASGSSGPIMKNAVQRLAESERETIARLLMGVGVQATRAD